MRHLMMMAVLAVGSTGCATQFMGTAPAASPDKTYVAGSDQNDATIWLCSKGGGECQKVEIAELD